MEKECQKKRYIFLPCCDVGGYFPIKCKCHVNVVLTICLQNEAASRRVSDLKAVVKCIEDHKLESEFSLMKLKDLKDQIASLEKENLSRKFDALIGCDSQPPYMNEKRCIAATTIAPTSTLSPVPSSITAVGCIITTATDPDLVPKTSSQLLSSSKHQCTMGSTEAVPDALIVATSTDPPLQFPCQHPTSLITNGIIYYITVAVI